MFVARVVASAFGTNCWVLATGPAEECVVVDPGFGVVPELSSLLAEHRLRPAAVLLTHGHADHTWSVTPVCRSASPVPAVHVHPEDRYRLRDPLADLPPELRHALAAQFGPEHRWTEPEDVVHLATGPAASPGASTRLALAGLELTVTHAPGHTEGSVVFGLAESVTGQEPLLVAGDLLFAGSIGRTDLPGGDGVLMRRSLDTVLPALPEQTVVLPGHGPTTTMAAERRGNPYLTAGPATVAGRPGATTGR